MQIYLAGPMRGYENFNHAAFAKAAAALRADGHDVFSPAEHDQEAFGSTGNAVRVHDTDPVKFARFVLKKDTSWICDNADVVALLPGWSESRGAQAERALAKAIGIDVWYLKGKKYA